MAIDAAIIYVISNGTGRELDELNTLHLSSRGNGTSIQPVRGFGPPSLIGQIHQGAIGITRYSSGIASTDRVRGLDAATSDIAGCRDRSEEIHQRQVALTG
jgi:hypothetical protein